MSADSAQGERRDRVLAAYDVVGGPANGGLDALVELAATVADVRFAAINLLSSHSQHQVATSGFQGSDTPLADSMCRRVVDSGQPVMLEDASRDARFEHSSRMTGETSDVRFYASHPLRTPTGVVVGTLCVFDDDTHRVTPEVARGLAQLADRVVDLLELRLASRRLDEANARLGTSNGRLAHFAGQMSHDLKNPLTSVSLSLESLELEVTDPYQVDMVARARRGVDRMTGMIDDLREFATEGVDPGDDLVDLGAELELALDDLSARVPRECVVSGELPRARGDAAQLRSVLMNLVDNAAKFAVDGERPAIEVDAQPLAGHHRIEVRDRGKGVPPEKRERIFAPLARLDKTIEGSGLGLATARRTIEAHGGTVGVEARDGGGSVFWFELPAVDVPSAGAAS